MNVLRRIAMGIGGTLVVALVMGLAAPKTAYAVLAALVTVTNTASNPVPVQSVDDHALRAFQESTTCTSGVSVSCQAQGLLPVPLGMTAVVQDVSGLCNFNPSATTSGFAPLPTSVALESINSAATAITADNPNRVVAVQLQAVFQGTIRSLNTHYSFGRPVTLYAASPSAGPQATLTFFVETPENFSADCGVNVSGYYVKNGL
jgi:hypothetical protein